MASGIREQESPRRIRARELLLRDRCTTSRRGRRILTLRPRGLHETLAAARTDQQTDTLQTRYGLRGVEGTINQTFDVTGTRRARYRGLPRVHLQRTFSATAINVVRLDTYWSGRPHDRTQQPPTRLSYQLAG
jgi:IS5 family transposase